MIKVKGQKASPEQIRNMKTIIAVGRKMKAPPAVIHAALMTATQESTLRNLNGGDRDSRGLFQQRPSQGWGTPAQVTTPSYAARKFYERAIPEYRKGTKDKTVLSQAVQRSAYPDAYRQWQREAGQNLRSLSKGAVSVSDGPKPKGKGNVPFDLEGPEKPSQRAAYKDMFVQRLMNKSTKPLWKDIVDTKLGHDSAVKEWEQQDAAFQDLVSTAETSDSDGGPGVQLPGGKLNIGPGGGWQGTERPIRNLYQWAAQGVPNTNVTSEKRGNPSPVAGTNSDHYVGNKNAFAYDIAVPGHQQPTPQLDKIASRMVRVLSRLDPNQKEIRNWGPKGGNFSATVNGIRYQLIWRSNTGGNHYNHINVGARRV
jgi:hypothetical protein